MKRIPTMAAVALLCSFGAAPACSSPSGDSGSGGGPGALDDVGADAAEARDAESAPDAGASEDAGSAQDGGGGGGVVIRGTVTASRGVSPVGATVEIVGASPANSTTVGDDGAYSMTVPPGIHFVRASQQGALAAQVVVATSQSTEVTELGLLANTLVSSLANRLGATFDPSKGLVVVGFATTDNGVGYGANLSADHDPPFAITSRGVPQTSSTTLSAKSNSLFFPNVATGVTDVSFAPPDGRACAVQVPVQVYRVDANVITEVVANCQ